MATWQSEPWLLKVFRGFNQWKTRLNHLLNNHLLPVQIDRGAFKCCAISDNGEKNTKLWTVLQSTSTAPTKKKYANVRFMVSILKWTPSSSLVIIIYGPVNQFISLVFCQFRTHSFNLQPVKHVFHSPLLSGAHFCITQYQSSRYWVGVTIWGQSESLHDNCIFLQWIRLTHCVKYFIGALFK